MIKRAAYVAAALAQFMVLHASGPGAASEAGTDWETVYPGVSFMSRMETSGDGAVRFHVARIDLQASGAELIVSPPKYKGAKTSTVSTTASKSCDV